MTRKFLLAAAFSVMVLVVIPAFGQQFPGPGDDTTSSLGSFKIQVTPQFVPLFFHPNPAPNPPSVCPGFDPSTNILSSPQLFDPATLIGRSMPIPDSSNASPPFPAGPPSDLGGAPVGSAGTIVSEPMLFPPPGFPCKGVSGCSKGPGTAEVHTEVRSLHMTGSGAAVRAGVWWNSPTSASPPPLDKISRGEVESQSGPTGAPNNNFPASSFFDVFVQVDVPACTSFPGAFPGGTLYNTMPLVVKNNQVTSFPPKVVYLHDSTSIVPILFLVNGPIVNNVPIWQADDILGYFLLVGHGVGFGQGQDDSNQFNNFMGSQSNATCPIGPPPNGSFAQPKSSAATPSSSKAVKTTSAIENKSSGGGNKSPGGGNR